MTLAEQLEQRGRAEGELRGRAQGEAQGRRAVLERQLTLKYGTISPVVSAKLAAAESPQLDEWNERIPSQPIPNLH